MPLTGSIRILRDHPYNGTVSLRQTGTTTAFRSALSRITRYAKGYLLEQPYRLRDGTRDGREWTPQLPRVSGLASSPELSGRGRRGSTLHRQYGRCRVSARALRW
ncbi:hypothetical protein GCM10012275_34420 [Longimycelium tulufanense]|uniref:Uncharacterized protein n=1 Tax=Longimycelium tulufanense TaxID=907463 RepID=A0A8J3CFE9_9PSEU|nr:hypothetical protein GCM10012275_34420 [Longimycelium tulufanense]